MGTEYVDDLTLRVLRLFSFDAPPIELWWRTDGEFAPVTFIVSCNDTFALSCADCERITAENIAILEQAVADAKAVGCEDYATYLFCTRIRRAKPWGLLYKRGGEINDGMRALLEAAGG